MNDKIIIGITGTLGAGKGAIVDYLKTKGFEHYSVRAFLIEEINCRQLPITLESMINVANDLRNKYGPSYIVKELYKRAQNSNRNVIIESVRSTGEVDGLKKLGKFYLISVDAPLKIRYQRVFTRNGDTADKLSFEEFIEKEKIQMHNTDDSKGNIAKCMELADFTIINEGSLAELNAQIEKILKNIC